MELGLSFCPGPIGSDSFLNPKWDARPLKQGLQRRYTRISFATHWWLPPVFKMDCRNQEVSCRFEEDFSYVPLYKKHTPWLIHVNVWQKPLQYCKVISLQLIKINGEKKTKIVASGSITTWQIEREKVEAMTDFIFLGSKIIVDGDCSYEIKRCLLLERKAMTNLDSILKSRDITLPTRVHTVKAMVFPVVMYGCWELDRKEGWVPNNWCFQTVVLEKTLESPLDSQEIKPVNPKGNQSWVFTGRTDVEAEATILWLPDENTWLIGKDPDAGKDRRQKEKRAAENEMVR